MNRLERAAVLSTLGNALLAVIKFAAGTTFGSVALVADAIHSFTDIVSSAAVFLGVRFSEVKSEKFPYGLYKLENLVSIFIALIIFWGGFGILAESLEKIGSPAQSTSVVPILAALVSLVIVYALTRYKQKVGREENSPSMISEARHSLLDVYSTLGVLAAVSLSFSGFPIADPAIGFIVCLLVFKAGAEILVDSAKVLLDASLDYKTIKKIEQTALAQKNLKVKELTARNSGRYIFVDLVLETDIKDLRRVSQLHRQCEEKIRTKIPRIDKIMIDIEYKKKEELWYAVPLRERSESSAIAEEFGTAPFFGLFKASNRPKEKGVLEKRIIENPHSREAVRRGILAAELLAKNSVDVLFSREEMHKGGSYYALQENFIETQLTKAGTFKEVLGAFG